MKGWTSADLARLRAPEKHDLPSEPSAPAEPSKRKEGGSTALRRRDKTHSSTADERKEGMLAVRALAYASRPAVYVHRTQGEPTAEERASWVERVRAAFPGEDVVFTVFIPSTEQP